MSAYETKSRNLEYISKTQGHETLHYMGDQLIDNWKPVQVVGRQITTSRENSRYQTQKKLDRIAREGKLNPVLRNAYEVTRTQDNGGDFETIKHTYEGTPEKVSVHRINGSYVYHYDGPWLAKTADVGPTSTVWPKAPTDLHDQMIAMGTTAIARTIPTNPAANTAQFLGELRERLPAVPGSAMFRGPGNPGSYADEYLNLEFGLKPLINDVQEIGRAVKDTERILSQLRRDSGKFIRRRYSFPVEHVIEAPVVESTIFPGAPALRSGSTGAYADMQGTLTRTRETKTEFWFSGCYSYLYAEGDSILARLKRAEQGANAVLGLRISPELFWELTPWSWAADWVSNLGDVIHNLSAFTRDGLVMRWGYVMCRKDITDTYQLEGVQLYGHSPAVLTQRFTTTVKKRVKATPYGFGLDTGAFTERQWAILAALGISRASRSL